MHNWGAGKARLMSGLSALLQLLDLACHTHSNQLCKNYRLHWFLVFICECLWVCMRVLMSGCGTVGTVCICAIPAYLKYTHWVYIHREMWTYLLSVYEVCAGVLSELDKNPMCKATQIWDLQSYLESIFARWFLNMLMEVRFGDGLQSSETFTRMTAMVLVRLGKNIHTYKTLPCRSISVSAVISRMSNKSTSSKMVQNIFLLF